VANSIFGKVGLLLLRKWYYCLVTLVYTLYTVFFIRFEARLQSNIAFTLEGARTVFTRSDITPPKVNRFGLNLEQPVTVTGCCRFYPNRLTVTFMFPDSSCSSHDA